MNQVFLFFLIYKLMGKYVNNFDEFINESKQVGDIYHWTSFAGVYKIIRENLIKTSNRSTRDDYKTILGDNQYGVSFTRDKTRYNWKDERYYPSEVCIVIDGNKLSTRFKLFPYNDFVDGPGKPNKVEADEMETRTNREVYPVKPYIKRIELYYNDAGASEEEQMSFAKWMNQSNRSYNTIDFTDINTTEDLRQALCKFIQESGIECILKPAPVQTPVTESFSPAEVESFAIGKHYAPQFIYSYINKLHKNGWEKKRFDDPEWVRSFSSFYLDYVNISDIKPPGTYHPPVAKIYSTWETEIPPIVMADGFIMDGVHRYYGALLKGQDKILCFTGVK